MLERCMDKVPNALTGMRVLLIPCFFYAFFHPNTLLAKRYFALLIFLAAGLTDIMDGYIARKYGAVSNFGKLFDPVADKGMMLGAIYCLYTTGLIGLWYVLVVGAKELLLIAGGLLMLHRQIVVQARFIGKAAALAMTLGIALGMVERMAGIGAYILYAALALTCAALASYCWQAHLALKNRLRSI